MSEPFFITSIVTKHHPHLKLKELTINLDNKKKQNVIITGRNGVGKSTLLKDIKINIQHLQNNRPSINTGITPSERIESYDKQLTQEDMPDVHRAHVEYEKRTYINSAIENGRLTEILFSYNKEINLHHFVFGYFEARRMVNLNEPSAITRPQLDVSSIGDHDIGAKFIEHLVNKHAQRAFAKLDNDKVIEISIDRWFINLEELFSELFNEPLTLKFNRLKLDFTLLKRSGEEIDLRELSDGYSAIIGMIAEIICRMDIINNRDFDVHGVVLIDEVETHLHVALQRHILRFLYKLFPNIQFIVTTHSPFILSSVDNAVIVDLESGQSIDQSASMWSYSYEDLIEGYFEVEKYSQELKDKIEQYKILISEKDSDLNLDQKKEIFELTNLLKNVPTFKNQAIELELRRLNLK
ncbi:AAA family ATPase [Vibrio fluvialis]|nr:AAA family ATPase [Vibrio fluvialis]